CVPRYIAVRLPKRQESSCRTNTRQRASRISTCTKLNVTRVTPAAAACRRRATPSGDYDDVAALQQDVLWQVPTLAHLRIAERQSHLLGTISTQDQNIIELRKGVRAAGHAECLHHVHGRAHDELARIIDLADDEYLVSVDLGKGYSGHGGR